VNNSPKKLEWAVWGGLALVVVMVAAMYFLSRSDATMPLPVIGRISDFNLTNQNNEAVSLKRLRGKVWVADIIFTRCPGPCAAMTDHLAELQPLLPAGDETRIVSLTSDPEYDTPEVLRKYAQDHGADTNRWWFLTGPKQALRELAVNDFKFVDLETKPEERKAPEDLFIHSTWYVLVDGRGQVHGWEDQDGRLHAYFDSTEPEERARLAAAVKQLLREKAG
jgi:protein SCO1/2